MNGMNNRLLLTLFVCFGILIAPELRSEHIIGGDLEYRCLGNHQYEIRLTLRRDCFSSGAAFDDPAYVGFFDASATSIINSVGRSGILDMKLRTTDTLNEILQARCGFVGGDVCVHKTIYIDTIFLPERSGGYLVAYQRCCRNSTIANILDPGQTGSTFTVFISEESLKLCNNSPQLNDYPPIYICADNPVDLDLHATDLEGDSIVYEMCLPFAGATEIMPRPTRPVTPFGEVIWSAAYSTDNMIGGNPFLHIESNNGRMIGHTTPDIAQYLVSYCVKEYRHGQLLSLMRREFQFNVRACQSKPEADFNVEVNNCKDSIEVKCFDLSKDKYSTIQSKKWKVTSSFGTLQSSVSNPLFVFPGSGSAEIKLIVESAIGCLDSITKTINFKPVVFIPKSDSIRICKGDTTRLTGSTDPNLSHLWEPAISLSCSNCPDPLAFPSSSTTYTLTLKDQNCEKKYFIPVDVLNCSADSCEVIVRQKCLPAGTVELRAVDFRNNLIVPKYRKHDLVWLVIPGPGANLITINNQNPVIVPANSRVKLISKLYSWPSGVPKTIEFAEICLRESILVADPQCAGPCDNFDFILSSCEDDYDVENGLNFPLALCRSICLDPCTYIIAVFEQNGNVVNASDYDIRWSTGATGNHVTLMGAYYNNLTVTVKKGDCVWYGKYIKSCKDAHRMVGQSDVTTRGSVSVESEHCESGIIRLNASTLQFYKPNGLSGTVMVYDGLGSEIFRKSISKVSDHYEINIADIMALYPLGHYFVRWSVEGQTDKSMLLGK